MKKPKNQNFSSWLDYLRIQGRSSFTKAEAQQAYGARASGLPMVLHRLLKVKKLAKPKHGFYVILDPLYRAQGCQPADWFVDALMKHLELPYYVGGLSAAALYGATHQAVQECEVVVPNERTGLRTILCGRVRIRFLRKTSFGTAVTQQTKAMTGYYVASSPEMTAWDMIYFSSSLGGPDAVGTVLRGLAESLQADRLAKVVTSQGDELVSRRLGWFLEKTGSAKLAAVLKPKEPSKLAWRPAVPSNEAGKFKHNEAWRLVENHVFDLD